VIAAALAAAPPGAVAADESATASAIVEGTNAIRQSQGLQPVERDAALDSAAQRFARFMARTGKYGHGADGRRPPQRAQAAGYDYCLVAENIAYHYRSSSFDSSSVLAQTLVEGWKESPEHRHNMLLEAATETGTGIAQGEGGRYFAVQMFGRPRSASIEFSIENRSSRPVQYTAGERSYELAPRVTRTHTLCRRPELSIEQPGKNEPFSARPKDGARYSVTARGVELSS
jgi:uncharacterized protein YkwD